MTTVLQEKKKGDELLSQATYAKTKYVWPGHRLLFMSAWGSDLDDYILFEMPDVDPLEKSYLTAEEYPRLADIWDNDDDAIFDTM